MRRSAEISSCGKYRYALWRDWDDGHGQLLFVGLNPSTADARVDDPTVRRCIRFAQTWGYRSVALGNLFALRSPSPRLLRGADDPVGPENDVWLDALVGAADRVVAAWGTRGSLRDRDREVLPRLGSPGALGVTGGGHPRHPLYLRRDVRIQPYSG